MGAPRNSLRVQRVTKERSFPIGGWIGEAVGMADCFNAVEVKCGGGKITYTSSNLVWLTEGDVIDIH